uniref:increased DNA methylation 1-like n=1 Tax=Erigeron canadensis TaxID=72917 RepID=UPI001CB8CFD0|nr:increased DNA methylation 1-like [Erigeron canadensis]
MEYVHCEAEYNPESITNYYSCGVQIGRIKNPDIKNMVIKARNHLSALGWSFYYPTKTPGKRELRYRSPAGKTYVTLRSACRDLIFIEEKPKKKNPFSKVGRPKKRIYSHDLDPFERETKLVKKDTNILRFDQEAEKKFEKKDQEFNEFFWSDSLPGFEKRDQQPKGKKRIRDMKRLMEAGKQRKKQLNSSFARRRCVLSLLIENSIVARGANVCYRKKDGEVIAKGRVYEDGIQCDCCGEFFLLSKFEAHAGSSYHRPAAFMFLEDGRSLCDCQNQLKFDNDYVGVSKSQELYEDDRVLKGAKTPESSVVVNNDEYCWICKDGGDLILCDSCTSSFHPTCLGLLDGIPDSDFWYCPFCSCGICDQRRIGNFTNVASNALSRIKCGQCEHKFDVECIRNMGVSISCDSINWFCKEECERIYTGLRGILGTSIPLSVINNLTWRLLKLDYEKDLDECKETYEKLYVALDIMHECFQIENHPLSENIIEDVVFSRYTKKSDFTGFFTAVLEKDQKIITVVNLRVHGCKVAEIPLVATRFKFRRQGMCRILMEELERKLEELGIERLVLPAIPDMVNTWTGSFGFNVMTQAECMEVADCKFLEFPGSIKCHKILKKM